jgi:hypothetical protein
MADVIKAAVVKGEHQQRYYPGATVAGTPRQPQRLGAATARGR